MQHFEIKCKELEDRLESKLIELRDANDELEELKNVLDEKNNSTTDFQKELCTLKEQVKSRQALEQQMICYEKELQNRLSVVEVDKAEAEKELEKVRDEVKSKDR